MSTVLKFKRSSEPGKVPLPGDLEPGEIAINDYDGTIYYKRYNGTIGSLSAGSSGGVTEEAAYEASIIMALALE